MNKKVSLLKKPAVQTLIASLLCIVLGLLIGYVALLLINPAGAWDAIQSIIKNFWTYSKHTTQIKNLGNTLVKTAPLLMCSLSVLFAYKVGLFNIGAAGQYVAGAGACIYCAVALGWNWVFCMIAAILAGALVGSISGVLKAYRNVNEVISCIMLNWITLYLINTLLAGVKEPTSNYTYSITKRLVVENGVASTVPNPGTVLPSLGLENLFNNNKYVGLALPLAVVLAIAVWVLLNKTQLGYELRATGMNKNAAKYCGMQDKQNIVMTMAIAGALAGMGAAMLYLTGIQQWSVTQSSVPSMGFNGIAAAFLGGLNPIGAIFSSFFIQHITDGGSYLDMRVYSGEISDLISSLIIYLCGFVFFFKTSLTNAITLREDKKLLDERRNKEGGKAS